MRGFWTELAGRLAGGERVFLALVAENTRHSPGTVGARMLVAETGETAGTVGGGVMERDLVERARRSLDDDERLAEVRTLHHRRSPGEGEPSGMICAGRQTNLGYLCRPELEGETVARVAALVAAGRSGTLRIDPGGMSVVEEPPDLSRPQRRLTRGGERDGDRWRYEEELVNRRRLAILGGGHCSLALARVMGRLGYDVFAFETRKKEPEAELREHARALEIVDDFGDAGGRIAWPELTWVVVMTSDFPSDVRALAGVVGRPFPFIGVMGSPAKLQEIFRRLKAEGFSAGELARVRSPVGLPIPSHTPEEIAISVAAQILQERDPG